MTLYRSKSFSKGKTWHCN